MQLGLHGENLKYKHTMTSGQKKKVQCISVLNRNYTITSSIGDVNVPRYVLVRDGIYQCSKSRFKGTFRQWYAGHRKSIKAKIENCSRTTALSVHQIAVSVNIS